MKRQIWLEFEKPSPDLNKLMQVSEARGAVVLSREYKPAFLVMTAEYASELLNILAHYRKMIKSNPDNERDIALPLEKAFSEYEAQKRSSILRRIVFHRLSQVLIMPKGSPRKPLPGFDDVQKANQIITLSRGTPPEEKLKRLSEHMRRWPSFIAQELTRLYEEYLAAKDDPLRSYDAWSAYGGYINQLLEHAAIRTTRRRARNVPIVHFFVENWSREKSRLGPGGKE